MVSNNQAVGSAIPAVWHGAGDWMSLSLRAIVRKYLAASLPGAVSTQALSMDPGTEQVIN